MIFALNYSQWKDNPHKNLNWTGKHTKNHKKPYDQFFCFCYISQKILFFQEQGKPCILKRSENHRDHTSTGHSQIIIRHLFERAVFLKKKFITEINDYSKYRRQHYGYREFKTGQCYFTTEAGTYFLYKNKNETKKQDRFYQIGRFQANPDSVMIFQDK